MSNQIVISSGAKVRSLEGVLTGTAGIVNSVPLGGANGVATLDSMGKVPLSQLPASVVTYLGTWNAATNTPTLTNGVGDVGDLYICNVAGTVNFGAGPITFAVGDWVIYNGSQWQKSAGASGTVTSVAVTSTGNDAISITGSPITTAGTINIGFAGDNTQYVNGAGDLTTFPSLTGYVPYTGATTDVDLGVHVLNAQALHVKGTAGAGHLGLKHQSAAATGSANESLIYANVDGDLAWQNDNLYLTTLSTHANTANRVYTFPDLTGTMAMLEGTQTFTGDKTFNGGVDFNNALNINNTFNLRDNLVGSTDYTNFSILKSGSLETLTLLFTTANSSKLVFNDAANYTYTFPTTSGTLALTSNLSSYVPYTGATTNVDLGNYSLTTNNFIYAKAIQLDAGVEEVGGTVIFRQRAGISGGGANYTTIGAVDNNKLSFGFWQDAPSGVNRYKFFQFRVDNITISTSRVYQMPDADGTIALTSNLSSYVPYTGATADVNLGTTYSLSANNITAAGVVKSDFGLQLKSGLTTTISGYLSISAQKVSTNSQLNVYTDTGFYFSLIAPNTANYSYTYPASSGTLVLGTGTTNYLPKFTGASTIGNSQIQDDGTSVGIGGSPNASYKLAVTGASLFSSRINGVVGGTLYNTAGLWLQGSSATDGIAIGGTAGGDKNIDTYGGVLRINATSGNGMSVTGNVGINTNSGTALLEILGAQDGVANKCLRLAYNGTYYGEYTEDSIRAFNNPLIFGTGTGGAERMRITSGGDVGIGGSISNQRLYVKAATSNGTTNAFLIHNSNSSDLMYVRSDGYTNLGLQSNSPYNYNATFSPRSCVLDASGGIGYGTSTRESKTNIQSIDDTSWLYQLNPVSFNYRKKDDENNYTDDAQDEKWYGLIADEVESINQDLVFYNVNEDGTKTLAGVEYTKLISVLVKSVQELSAKVTALENK